MSSLQGKNKLTLTESCVETIVRSSFVSTCSEGALACELGTWEVGVPCEPSVMTQADPQNPDDHLEPQAVHQKNIKKVFGHC